MRSGFLLLASLLTFTGSTAHAAMDDDASAARDILRSARDPRFVKQPEQLTSSRDAWLSLGGSAFLDFRPTKAASAQEVCFEALAGNLTADQKLEFRGPFGDLTFCQRPHLINALSFPALNRVTLVADKKTPQGTVSRVFLFEASTGRKLMEREVEGEAHDVLPYGPDGLIVRFADRIEVLPKPDPRLAGVSIGNMFAYDLPYVRAYGPHGFVVLNIVTAEVWNADSAADAKAYGDFFFSEGRLTFVVTHGKEQHLVTVPLVRGGAPRDLGTVPSSWNGPLWVAGNRAYFQSAWTSPWSELLQQMSWPSDPLEPPCNCSLLGKHHDAADRLHHFAEPPSNENPPGDVYFSDDVPSEAWELAVDLDGASTASPRCYEVLGRMQNPADRDPRHLRPLETLPGAKPCERAWMKAAQKIEQITMKPFTTVHTPAQAAKFCLSALLSQRSMEMLRCLDVEGMLAGDPDDQEELTDTTPDLAEHMAWYVAARPFDEVSHPARVVLLRAFAAGDAPSGLKLTGVTSKGFTATWRVGHGQKPATLRMSFVRAGKAVRPRLPWLLKDAEVKTATGQRKVFVTSGRLPDPRAPRPTRR